MKKKLKKFWKSNFKNKFFIVTILIFILDIFLRFYNIEGMNPFGYDQVDNAWVAKGLIQDGRWPLVGMVAKGNSGIFIGPAYYYLISLFYWVFSLDPIASGIFAGFSGIFTFWALFYVAKKIFSYQVAIIAVFINTVAFNGIIFDRIQWPVNFIPGISILIFYFLYKVITGNPKYIIFLSLAIGFSFQIHFTSIFFPIIVILSLPFFPRNKETIKYILISIPLFLIWLVPNVIAQIKQGNSQTSNLSNYLATYYHGFHLRRVMQLVGDGFIQFEHYFYFKILKFLKYLLPPLFIVLYLYKNRSREKVMFCFLMVLWFLIPLLVFSTYKGEISDYYFSVNRFVTLIIISYFFSLIFNIKNIIPKIIIILLLGFYAYFNLIGFFTRNDTTLHDRRINVLEKINKTMRIEYTEGDPESYLYYYYMNKKGVVVY